jgi:hypothetical protein
MNENQKYYHAPKSTTTTPTLNSKRKYDDFQELIDEGLKPELQTLVNSDIPRFDYLFLFETRHPATNRKGTLMLTTDGRFFFAMQKPGAIMHRLATAHANKTTQIFRRFASKVRLLRGHDAGPETPIVYCADQFAFMATTMDSKRCPLWLNLVQATNIDFHSNRWATNLLTFATTAGGHHLEFTCSTKLKPAKAQTTLALITEVNHLWQEARPDLRSACKLFTYSVQGQATAEPTEQLAASEIYQLATKQIAEDVRSLRKYLKVVEAWAMEKIEQAINHYLNGDDCEASQVRDPGIVY